VIVTRFDASGARHTRLAALTGACRK